MLAALLISGVCGQETSKLDTPTVVEGISVSLEEEQAPIAAQERIDFSGEDDQIALESNIAEDRDHSVVVAPPDDQYAVASGIDTFSAPQGGNSYSAPQQSGNSYSAPQQEEDSYGSPQASVEDSYGSPQAPVEDGYGSPQAPPVEDGYGSPQAPPVQDGYGSPQAPPVQQDSYGSPQAPPQQNYGPIPVPLSVPVKPSSLVLPQQPQGGYGPPKPQYNPRPQPPKRPSYRPPPPIRRPPPQRPQYKPQKPVYKPRPGPPKPQYKPRPGPPKPQYRPQKPQYKPPQKPQYKPQPKPQYGPPKPQYKPQPSQPKPQYKPAPAPIQSQPQNSYSQPAISSSNSYTSSSLSTSSSHSSPSHSSSSSSSSSGDPWPQAQPEMPKITSLDVTCEKNLMKVFIEFDKPFYGIIFSKGHYSDVNCVHLPAGLGRTNAKFDVSINSCGTTGNTENGLYGYGADSGSGTFFENTIVVQYDPQVQEVWDQARKLRCTWHDQYEKSVTFRPFPVDMLDVVRADFAGDNVGCWMQIQVGKGPWASEVSGLVKIGQTMTMVLAIKDDDQKFDMLVRNCMAHDGKRAPIQLVDQKGCVTRPKLMSKFTKIKNFGASASVLSYAHFQAFKFPDSMEVHFQCTIQICRYQCPDQCDSGSGSQSQGSYIAPSESQNQDSYGSPQGSPVSGNEDSYGSPQSSPVGNEDSYGSPQGSPVEQDSYGSPQSAPQSSYSGSKRARREAETEVDLDLEDVGVEKVIQVVSSGDLTFAIKESDNETVVDVYPPVTQSWAGEQGYICMSTPAFAATLVILLAILVISCLLSAFLCLRHRSYYGETSLIAAFANPVFAHKKSHF